MQTQSEKYSLIEPMDLHSSTVSHDIPEAFLWLLSISGIYSDLAVPLKQIGSSQIKKNKMIVQNFRYPMPYLLLLSNKHFNVFKENSSTYVRFKDQLHSHFFSWTCFPQNSVMYPLAIGSQTITDVEVFSSLSHLCLLMAVENNNARMSFYHNTKASDISR